MTDRMIRDITEFIFVSDTPRQTDAVFLPGSSHPAQPEYGAQLYKMGLTRWLVPAGGISIKRDMWPGVREKAERYRGDYQSDYAFFRDVLLQNGVPASAIVGEDQSRHTRDNAFFSRRTLDAQGICLQSAMIVCKAFHARRCLMLYQLAFPRVQLSVCPVHCFNITRENWFTTEEGVNRVFGELARCGNQFVPDIKRELGLL